MESNSYQDYRDTFMDEVDTLRTWAAAKARYEIALSLLGTAYMSDISYETFRVAWLMAHAKAHECYRHLHHTRELIVERMDGLEQDYEADDLAQEDYWIQNENLVAQLTQIETQINLFKKCAEACDYEL